MLTCLWEKLAKEKKSLFLLFLPSFAARGGFERNEMGRGRMSLGCFIIALSFSSGRLQSCFVLPSWKLAELKEGRTIKTILNTVSRQLEFISWRVNQFLWVSTKPCKPPMKSFYIGSNVIITLLSFFCCKTTTKLVWFVPSHICHICYIVVLLLFLEYQTT